MVEQLALNETVVGSNPTGRTIDTVMFLDYHISTVLSHSEVRNMESRFEEVEVIGKLIKSHWLFGRKHLVILKFSDVHNSIRELPVKPEQFTNFIVGNKMELKFYKTPDGMWTPFKELAR